MPEVQNERRTTTNKRNAFKREKVTYSGEIVFGVIRNDSEEAECGVLCIPIP